MAMGANAGTGKAISGINITPLIDVLLVLLIIFMVIVPAIPRGLSSEVTQRPQDRDPQHNETTVVLQVVADGKGEPSYFMNQSPLSRAQIVPQLPRIFSGRENRQVFVKGDVRMSYASIAEVIDMAHQAGVDQVGLITPRVQMQQ